MIDDFPVLGYPIKPTEICFRLECNEENCRSKVIKEPLPKEFVSDAWKASVGYSVDNCFTHFACESAPFLKNYIKTKPGERGACVATLRVVMWNAT